MLFSIDPELSFEKGNPTIIPDPEREMREYSVRTQFSLERLKFETSALVYERDFELGDYKEGKDVEFHRGTITADQVGSLVGVVDNTRHSWTKERPDSFYNDKIKHAELLKECYDRDLLTDRTMQDFDRLPIGKLIAMGTYSERKWDKLVRREGKTDIYRGKGLLNFILAFERILNLLPSLGGLLDDLPKECIQLVFGANLDDETQRQAYIVVRGKKVEEAVVPEEPPFDDEFFEEYGVVDPVDIEWFNDVYPDFEENFLRIAVLSTPDYWETVSEEEKVMMENIDTDTGGYTEMVQEMKLFSEGFSDFFYSNDVRAVRMRRLYFWALLRLRESPDDYKDSGTLKRRDIDRVFFREVYTELFDRAGKCEDCVVFMEVINYWVGLKDRGLLDADIDDTNGVEYGYRSLFGKLATRARYMRLQADNDGDDVAVGKWQEVLDELGRIY